MDRCVYDILKSKRFHSKDDIACLLVLCGKLFDTADDLEVKLKEAIKHIFELENRLMFYRSATQPKVIEDAKDC